MKSYVLLRDRLPYKKGDVVSGLVLQSNPKELRVTVKEGKVAVYKIGEDVGIITKTTKSATTKTKAPSTFAPVNDTSAQDAFALASKRRKQITLGVIVGASVVGAGAGVLLGWKMKKPALVKVGFAGIGAILLGSLGMGTAMILIKKPEMPKPEVVEKNPVPVKKGTEKPVSYQESLG